MSTGKKDERSIVRDISRIFDEEKPPSLKKVIRHTNLATKRFREIWSEWWGDEVPPKLEVDLILVFEDRVRDDVLLVGTEVEYFKGRAKSFYDGLQQALSFALFGFDSLVLWHIFSDNMEDHEIERYVRPLNEIVEGLELPIVYLATKLVGDGKFEFFAPYKFYSSNVVDVRYLLEAIMGQCDGKRNPLLSREEVVRRRKMMKVLLEIPV